MKPGRILAIDAGRKRCGIAVTDPARIVATGLDTVPTASLAQYVAAYAAREPVLLIVVGEPHTLAGEASESARFIEPTLARLRKALPGIAIERFDERFTSVLAHRAMLDGGLRRDARRDKALVDKISATIILSDFLESRRYKELEPTL